MNNKQKTFENFENSYNVNLLMNFHLSLHFFDLRLLITPLISSNCYIENIGFIRCRIKEIFLYTFDFSNIILVSPPSGLH